MSVVFPINPDDRFDDLTAAADQTLFSISFPFQDVRDLQVRKVDTEGAIAELAHPADYAVVGAGNPAGGSLTLTVGAAAGERIQIIGQAVLDRLTSITQGGKFSSKGTDDELDRGRLIHQELNRDIGRALKVEHGDQPIKPLPIPQPGTFLAWTEAGDGLENRAFVVVGAENLPATPLVYFRRNAAGDAFEAINAEQLRDDVAQADQAAAQQSFATPAELQAINAAVQANTLAIGVNVAAIVSNAVAATTALLDKTSEAAGFRNKLINGDFSIAQRGTNIVVAAASSAYTLDRWFIDNGTNQSVTVTREEFAAGDATVPGNPAYFLRLSFATAPTTGSIKVAQRIEGVRTLSGRGVTSTYHIASSAAATDVKNRYVQNFGGGGSVSVSNDILSETINNGGFASKSTSVDLPDISGKTIGANDHLEWLVEITARHVATYDLAHASLVDGNATAEPDPFSPRHAQTELAMCKRYFEVLYVAFATNAFSAVTNVMPWQVEKRRVPDLVSSPDNGVNGQFSAALGSQKTSIFQSVGNSADSGGSVTGNAEY